MATNHMTCWEVYYGISGLMVFGSVRDCGGLKRGGLCPVYLLQLEAVVVLKEDRLHQECD